MGMDYDAEGKSSTSCPSSRKLKKAASGSLEIRLSPGRATLSANPRTKKITRTWEIAVCSAARGSALLFPIHPTCPRRHIKMPSSSGNGSQPSARVEPDKGSWAPNWMKKGSTRCRSAVRLVLHRTDGKAQKPVTSASGRCVFDESFQVRVVAPPGSCH